MCLFQIYVWGDARFSEIVSDEVENTELAVEDVMSHALLNLFGGGTVEDVAIQFFPDPQKKHRRFAIQIYLQCACQQFVLRPLTEEHMQSEVKKQTYTLLRELFASLEVGNVELIRTPWVYEEGAAPACVRCCARYDQPLRRGEGITVD